VFFEELNKIVSIESFANFADLKIFAKKHKLVDSHNSIFMLDLLECCILAVAITDFAVMFKYHLQIIFVLF
jgi:hypothetical protein